METQNEGPKYTQKEKHILNLIEKKRGREKRGREKKGKETRKPPTKTLI